MDYFKLFEELYLANVRYLVCGGLAVNIYGIPIMTADVDLLVDFNEPNIDAFLEVMKKLNYQTSLPISLKSLTDEANRNDLIKNKNLIAFSFFNYQTNAMALDVLVDVPILFNVLWETKVSRKFNNVEMYLVSLEYLIKMKQYEFPYHVTEEQIIRHQQLSIEQIFQWLHDTNVFLNAVQTPEEKEQMKKLKHKKNWL